MANVKQHAKNFRAFNPHEAGENFSRSQERYRDLIRQFDGCYKKLIGRNTLLVMPGNQCTHAPDEPRPVHVDWPRWKSRPEFVFLTVGLERMMLSVARSEHRAGALFYMNGNGELPCSFDFYQMPRKGAHGEVLDGFKQHKLFANGCDMLQKLLDEQDEPAGDLVLPRLLIKTSRGRVDIDESKFAAMVAAIRPELREANYESKKRSEAVVTHLGETYCDAAVMSDEAVKDGFIENRAFEDYSALLGTTRSNPYRKIHLASNPAFAVLTEMNLPLDWASTATTELVDRMLKEMRHRLPLPERALDSDLIDALENPSQPVKFSVPVEKVPIPAIVKAMKNALPKGSALRHSVEDADLHAAAQKPDEDLFVRNYSKIQVFSHESIRLPSYASGTFFARPRATGLELA
jgi:hypothetical protein